MSEQNRDTGVTHVTAKATESPMMSFARVAESDLATARGQEKGGRTFEVSPYTINVKISQESAGIPITAKAGESPLVTFANQAEQYIAVARRQDKNELTFHIDRYEIHVKF